MELGLVINLIGLYVKAMRSFKLFYPLLYRPLQCFKQISVVILDI